MRQPNCYQRFIEAYNDKEKLLAVLIDPDKFSPNQATQFLRKIPLDTTHIFVGGSTVAQGMTNQIVEALKLVTSKPIIIFPGDYSQIAQNADALLFLSLFSGRNPEYLIGQQVKAVAGLRTANLEVISTGYILIDGGKESAVARVTATKAMSQKNMVAIVDTAKAATLIGAKLIYLEAGSGASYPVAPEIISAVRKEITVPLIVGGGIRTEKQKLTAYAAGANMLVMGTVYEHISLEA